MTFLTAAGCTQLGASHGCIRLWSTFNKNVGLQKIISRDRNLMFHHMVPVFP